jgi:multidrug efflux pump subunit AcrB
VSADERDEPAGPGEGEPPKAAAGVLAWFTKNTVASNIIMFVLLAGGVMIATQIKQEVFPEVTIEQVLINVPYPGASPAEVESGVVLAIEEAVRGLEGVKEVRGTAAEGTGVVAVDLITGTDVDRALNDVKAAVDRITSFPEEIERPVISTPTTRSQVISLGLYGDVSEQVLHDLAENARQELTALPDITYTELSGTRPLEIAVEVPQAKLREHRLTLDQVAQAIRQSSVEIPAGGIRTRGGEVLLRTAARAERGSEVADIVIRSNPDGTQLRVGDIGTVTDGFRDMVEQETHFNGERAVLINVFRAGDQSPLTIADHVHQWVRDHEGKLPPGVQAVAWNDSSEIYADRIDLLLRNAFIGLALVLFVLGLFLEPRLAFWVTLGIPISFAGSMLFIPLADVSINMISLFAFIVTLGMVVDDAIVVGESIHQKRAEGMPRLKAAVEGAKEVFVPVCFAIVTTCVFFAPMLFVPGVSGKFFRNIPIVVIAVLLISLVESLLILPAHLSHKMPWWLELLLLPLLIPLRLLQKLKVEKGLLTFIDKGFTPFLRATMRWRYVTLAVAIMIFMTGVVGPLAGGRMKFNFMPKIEGDLVVAQLRMPVGTAFEETEGYEERMTETARAVIDEHGGDDILRGIFAQAGSATAMGSPRGSSQSTGSHLANVMVWMVPVDERPIRASEMAEEWRTRLGEIPGAELLSFTYSLGASAGSPIDVRLSHPDNEVLEEAAMRLAADIESYEGLRDIDSGVSAGKEQLDLSLTAEGRARGLTEAMLAQQVRNAYYGAEAVRQQRGREELRVYVRRPESERVSMDDIEQLIIRTPDGGEMPLARAAHIERGRAYTSISRVDGRRVVSVTADIIAGVGNATEIAQKMQEAELARLVADVPGLSYEMGGEQKEQAESLGSLVSGFGFALFIVFGLLAMPFKSYIQPILVLSAIPFGFVGAFLGHFLLGFDLSIISMMGMVALSGVVVNDSLILIVAINELRAKGNSIWDSVVEGTKRRFRPILLTSLTTFFGLTPMILEPSVQARFLVPMAISLGFGVLMATIVLVVLVPSLYLILEDARRGGQRLMGTIGAVLGVDEDELPEPTGLRESEAPQPPSDEEAPQAAE